MQAVPRALARRAPLREPAAGRRRLAAAVATLFALLGALLAGGPVQAQGLVPEATTIQFLNVADWHGQIDPVSVFGVGDIGGAAALSSYWQADRAANPNTLTLTGGDAYGAAPPLSSFFEEEPAVLAMRMMGFDADTFGNHNFDRGTDHLQKMIDLAAAPTGPDAPGEPFQYVSANLRNRDDNLSGVKDFEIFDVGGAKVAVIGLTNPEAPELVFPGNFGTIEVTDPVTAANRARAAARRAGANVFVVITHMGVRGFDPVTGEPFGELIDFAEAVGGFDIIFGDHTDVQFEGVIDNQLVIENRSKGVTYTRTELTVDPRNGRVIGRSNEFVTPFANAVTPDPAIEAVMAPFRADLAAAFDEPIGVATDTFVRGGNIERLVEVPIGNLVADSMRERYGTEIAFTNGGGIRAPLPSSYEPLDTSLRRPAPGFAAGPPWDLVVGDAFAVLPFGNSVVTREITGALLHDVLELGVAARPGANGRFLQVSGFSFVYDSSQPVGDRVLSVTLDGGTPILPDGTVYTVATNDFVNAGGDGYTMLADGTGVTRELMADVLLEHIRDLGTLTPAVEGRITDLNPAG